LTHQPWTSLLLVLVLGQGLGLGLLLVPEHMSQRQTAPVQTSQLLLRPASAVLMHPPLLSCQRMGLAQAPLQMLLLPPLLLLPLPLLLLVLVRVQRRFLHRCYHVHHRCLCLPSQGPPGYHTARHLCPL
jgi:hypothetical protein